MSDEDSSKSSPVIGGLEIRRNGSIFIKKSLALSLTEEDHSKFDITVEFLIHALNRTDWMTEFLQKKIVKEQERKRNDLRSSLRVIEGGNNADKKD
jgi:hypothetical protein